jgi:hypothetical protein
MKKLLRFRIAKKFVEVGEGVAAMRKKFLNETCFKRFKR